MGAAASNRVASRTLAIVPARGGSKGIPRKNIRALGGHPLLAYTLAAARSAGIEAVLLSTDDTEIAEVGRNLGFMVPFLRPSDLAGDEVATIPVLLHAVEELRRRGELDGVQYVCLLQPTSPFRDPQSIVRCLEQLERSSTADSAVTVQAVPCEHNPHWVYRMAQDGAITLFTGEPEPIVRRQDLPPVFHRDGSVYVVRLSVLLEQKSLYGRRTIGIEVDGSLSVNLDALEDWREAELLIEAHPRLARLEL